VGTYADGTSKLFSGIKMESNLYEFVGMVSIVFSATFFILMFRWGIYKFGQIESEIQQSIEAQTDSISATQQ